ncbi:cytochrome c family protein [Elioraea sp. Yellowstone]|jgi:cytochrome c|uniref:c-type cytochrome n=1 Tax=Elioraea sp. Yellowstone TaxID=2592070 RepID=UPI00114DE1A0|nr:cytochrome c family protein [Elioraea sp. Yellowstone]TQF77633.1 cytochrome c family protein [Elioraea sp. Yellowstone]
MKRILLAATAVALAAVTTPAAAQDAAAGQRVFNQCRACHTIEAGGRNGVGPNLHGVVGRKAASVDGFRYSPNMRELAEGGLTWTEENLDKYLTNPKSLVPRGSMAFAGLRNEQQRKDVIAYLKQNSPGS